MNDIKTSKKPAVGAKIYDIKPNSLAERYGLRKGDAIISIEGRELRDILDYEIASSNEKTEIVYVREGRKGTIRIYNPGIEPLGIYFDKSLFDGIKTCRNKCVFCFIDQLPPGMRKPVYVKDDDYRLSFLYGNFVTLTNVADSDIKRIIEDRISPLYISIHTTNSKQRKDMLGRKKDDKTFEFMKTMSEAGIEMHVQIVLCPEINDGILLDNTLNDLMRCKGIDSVGIVPVGLTGFREGLYNLRSFEKKEIIKLIEHIQKYQYKMLKEREIPWVYMADELYIKAGLDIPPAGHYGDYPQIENGIGLTRLFLDDASAQITKTIKREIKKDFSGSRIFIVTGELFKTILDGIISDIFCKIYGGVANNNIKPDILSVNNEYFGGNVAVSGLLTGRDIIASVREFKRKYAISRATDKAGEKLKSLNKSNKEILIIPDIVLNSDGLLLDDSTPKLISDELDMDVKIIRSTGKEAVKGIVDVIINTHSSNLGV